MGLVSIKALEKSRKEFYMTHLYCGKCGKWRDISSVKWNIRDSLNVPTVEMFFASNLKNTRI
jgi:hypothetical protein